MPVRYAGSTSPVTPNVVAEVTGIPRGARGAVAALMAGLFLAALDQSLFATALPTIAGDLGAPVLRALVPVAAMAAVLLWFLRPVPQDDHRDRAWSDD